MAIIFEWDDVKDRANQKKHGVGFEEARLVFEDPFHVSEIERVVEQEERWQTFGLVGGIRILMVVHTINEDWGDEIYRLISARVATKSERRIYEEQDR